VGWGTVRASGGCTPRGVLAGEILRLVGSADRNLRGNAARRRRGPWFLDGEPRFAMVKGRVHGKHLQAEPVRVPLLWQSPRWQFGWFAARLWRTAHEAFRQLNCGRTLGCFRRKRYCFPEPSLTTSLLRIRMRRLSKRQGRAGSPRYTRRLHTFQKGIKQRLASEAWCSPEDSGKEWRLPVLC
jgi:hypothetical protein